MKKEEAILKINKLGNVANIIVRICKIFVILGLTITLLGTVATMVLPKNLVKMDMGATAEITVDMSTFGVTFTEEDKEAFASEANGRLETEEKDGHQITMSVNGSVYETEVIEMGDHSVRMRGTVDTYTVTMGDLLFVMILGIVSLSALFVTLVFSGRLCRAFRDCESPFEETVVKNLTCLAYSLFPWVVMNSVFESLTESIFTNNVQLILGVDLGVVVVILLIFVLAYIFKYGAVLQQESDETL
jgi:hypothetical protein